MTSEIAQRLTQVRARVASAAARCGREPAEVRLIAVGKMQPVAALRAAWDAGQRDFGENYAQELVQKCAALADCAIDWHCIGHLQRNKVKLVVPHAAWIHTLDSLRLAEAMHRAACAPVRCLIEVNIAGEAQKHGVAPHEVAGLLAHCAPLAHVQIHGLMCIPPPAAQPEDNRHHFRRLATLLHELNQAGIYPAPLRELSMGMSDDFEVAIEEGATMVRVGTAIFGERG